MLFIFDIGGVCTNNVPIFPLISQSLGITQQEFLFYCGIPGGTPPTFLQNKDVYFSNNIFLELTKGNITVQQFWKEFSQRSTLETQQDYFGTFFNPTRNEKVYETIAALKIKNRVVNGTNTIQTHYNIHMQKHHYDLFQQIYASQSLHEAKPELSFWKYILSEEGFSPVDTFFIDDTEENIKAAETLGIKCHLFTTAENLIKEVSKYF